MPDQSVLGVGAVGAREADLVQGKLSVLVEDALGGDPCTGLVVVDLDRAVPGPGDAVDDPLHAVLAGVIEGEDDALLEAENLALVEGVVAEVVPAEAVLAELSVVRERCVLADDSHPRRVVGLLPELVVAIDDLFHARDLVAADEDVEPLEHLVHALADERLDPFGLARDLQDVSELELLRAVLEARQARVAVDGGQADPRAAKIGAHPDGCRRSAA